MLYSWSMVCVCVCVCVRERERERERILDIKMHVQAKLEAVLSGHVEMLLLTAGDGTWQEIREYSECQTQSAISEISSAVSGFRMDEHTYNEMVLQLKDYARGVIQAKARQEAVRVLTHMNDRYSHGATTKWHCFKI